jgi:antitoxin ParD1/3/4
MSTPMTLNVRVNGELSKFVADNVSDAGSYDNVSEYVRDLIRRDKARADLEKFQRLKAELALAFSAPDNSYGALTMQDIITRNAIRKIA